MKFKKVEISAFRIYDKPEDATFDFSLPDGIADFVAIYAPNGFGKTSFYDAIEWGVTNNINRFWQDAAITEKSIEALKDINESQIKLWRNTYSEQDTFVKILTDSQTVFNRTLNVHGNSRIDITNEEVVENKGFRQVILSQEWISAFLKEINGERRYEIFMENPDLREINSYYSNLKSIFSLTQERINVTRQLIADKQKELIASSEGNVVQAVNTQITNLNSKYQAGLPQLSITSTQENVVEFKNTISAQIVGATSSIASVQTKLDSIGVARSGSSNILSEPNYQETTKRIPQVEKEIETITANLKRHEALKSLIDRRNSLNTSFQKKINESEILTQIIEDFQTYLEVSSAINKYQSEIKTNKKELSDLESTSDNYQEQLRLANTKQDSTLRNISETEAKVSQVPELARQLNEVTIQIADKKRIQSELYLIIETDKVDAARIVNDINRYNQLKENLSISALDIQSDSYPKELEKQYQNLRATKLSVSALKQSIEDLQIKIDQQEEFNNTIQNFINEGYEIIRQNQTRTCPLCEFEYASFSELASKVTNNKALASLIQDLLQQKQTLQESINTQNSLVDSEITFVTKYYENLIQDLNLTLSTLQGKIAATELQQSKNNEELGFLETKSHELVSHFKGLSAVEYENQLSESLNQLIKERESNAETVMKIEKNVSSSREKINLAKASLQQLLDQLLRLKDNPKFISVGEWLRQNALPSSSSITPIQDKLSGLSNEITRIATSLEEMAREIENTQLQIGQAPTEETQTELGKLRAMLEQHRSSVLNFEYFVFNKLGERVNSGSVGEILERLEKDLRIALQSTTDLLNEYQLLEKYSENILPYLKSEITKQEIRELEEELALINGKVYPIILQEKRNTKEYMERKVQDFFYTALINKIYNKIDPHPDYKSVEFKVDFDADTPRLDIFVVSNEGEGKLIPNLYFSTAQINILSLSIFLASALNSTTYKSIFIDDPIQSMDSINVLSTIDLIRSIVVNERRQIILSTHDNNFYNLLKKKIPYPQYRSRFIELETFGKVKVENASF